MDLSAGDNTYLGLDLSTQQLKAVVIDERLEIVQNASVHFDSDLPEFRTHGGVMHDKLDPHAVTAPTLMWVKALDMLMDRLTLAEVDFSKIAAVSGSAQQHGSAYWQNGAENKLRNLNPSQFLHEQLAASFSVANSPVWMDASTSVYCKKLEDAVGGPLNLAALTGSRAYERFTGSQIAKIAHTKPESYENTERISLVSSFLCSLFLGKVAPIDYSDGSGMNLMNIKTKKWVPQLLDVCGTNLAEKLGEPVPSRSVVGNISSYFVERWGFNDKCSIVAFTGDNPASLIGMKLNEGWVGVSLGTSDTVFLWLSEPKAVLDGHIFCNPVDRDAYMPLLCFKNGSLSRERIRDKCAEGSWSIFDQLLDSTPRGNFGNMGLYFDEKEILPFLQGDFRFNRAGEPVTKFSSLEVEVRALVEGQFVAKRVYAEDMGFKIGEDTKILATGGASVNKPILQVISDVFNAPVYLQDTADSACLGAAYQARLGLFQDLKYTDLTSSALQLHLICTPFKDSGPIYEQMAVRYRCIVDNLIKENK